MSARETVDGMIQTYGRMVQQMVALQEQINQLNLSFDFMGSPDQAFGHFTYAQHGEDLLLLNYFHILGIKVPTWLDIGAHHPLNISNTALLYKFGGHGVNIEANPNLIQNFIDARPRDTNVNVGIAPRDRAGGTMTFYMIDKTSGRNTFDRKAAEEFVAQYPQHSIREEIPIQVISIEDAVERYCGGTYPDLLTIDVENLDYDILASADFSKTRPKFICAEVVSAAGESSGKMKALMSERGFVVLARTTGNYIFADRPVAELCR